MRQLVLCKKCGVPVCAQVCAYCGWEIEDPGCQLLMYLEERIRMNLANLESLKTVKTKWSIKRVAATERTVERRKAWVRWVEERIENEDGP